MPATIEIDSLTLRYPGAAEPAVRDLSFSVEQGEIFGLLGPNGAGKTTTIAMLSCLLAPSGGKARIAGHDLLAEAAAVKRVIGLVPQDLAIYPTLSARDNLRYFGSLYGLAGRKLAERVQWGLEMVGLSDRADDRIDTFSGGMKRRVNIAAGLLHEPRVLFLDEPTVGVDPQSRNFIFDGVEALKRAGLTVIYTTHYMEEAERLCDRLAIVDHGRLIALDTPQALVDSLGGVVVIGIARDGVDALGRLRQIGGVSDVALADGCIKIRSAAPAQVLARAIEAVSSAGLEIRSVEVLEHNLESVFLELTGRRLRE